MLQELGLGRSLVIGLFILPELVAAGALAQEPTGAWILVALLGAGLFWLHRKRTDHGFLKLLGNSRQQLFAIEYAGVVAVFALLAVAAGNWMPAASMLALPAIALLPSPAARKQRPPLPVPFVPTRAFEWRSGLRKSGIALVILWLASLGLSWVIAVPLLGMLFMAVTISAFYDEYEQMEWLQLMGATPGQLLATKVRDAVVFAGAFLVPPFVGSMVFHPELWAFACYALVGCMATVLFSLFTKYAMYEPAANTEGKSMQTGIFVLFFTIPFLAPITLIWVVRNAFRARKNLAAYFRPTSIQP